MKYQGHTLAENVKMLSWSTRARAVTKYHLNV